MSKIKTILVPTDFSPASWKATLYALNLCKQHEATMTLLHVVPGVSEHDTMQTAYITKSLDSISKQLNDDGPSGRIKTVTKAGTITHEILFHIKQVPYDLVVMGLNGNGGLNKNIGKHARQIVQDSSIPVWLVPNK